ncbi:MAG TPA: cupin domain-containing protein [Actinomycetota bacterium]|nr:cupin domain-containing protein [Actinomycetota bacterium]
MPLSVTRWGQPEAPTEASVRAVFATEGLSPYAWSNGPGDRYAVHTHSFDKVLICAQGSIAFQVAGEDVTLQAGDRLDLPAGTPHGALVGPRGCVCLEAHR